MTHYKIVTPGVNYVVAVKGGGEIVHSVPAIAYNTFGPDSYASVSWKFVRELAAQRGWTIIPLLEHPTSITYRNQRYRLEWREDDIVRISTEVDGETRDITWDQLPRQLKEVLL